jgi:glucose dehydrogenase
MHPRALRDPALALLILTVCLTGAALAQGGGDWPAYNGGVDGDHYSRLTQINRSNVHTLRLAWRFDTGEMGQIEANPLIIGHTLYAYTPTQKVIALDASTGALRWKFDSGINGTQPARGLATWTDGRQRRIFAGVMNFLYCLDAETGRPVESFADQGRIDLRKGLGRPFEKQSIALTTPGVVYKDLIIVGGRNPETHPAPPGYIRAYDVHTGQLRWVFHTIPLPSEPGYETWPRDAWKTAGAANNWAGMSIDVEHGIVYAPTGSAVMDFYGGDRVGDDLYADSILALDAETGKLLWHFQGVHHDIWDRDFPAPPALFTVKRGGKRIDALAQTSKQGFVYLFDRINGEPLAPIHEHPYPGSSVPGEVAAPTQPLPDWPAPFARQRLSEDMLTTRTAQAHAWAVNAFRQFRSDGQFLPFTVGQQTVVFPGFDGGAEWGGPALDPVHQVLFVNANEMVWTGGLVPAASAASPGEKIYRDQCAICHGIDRAGSPPAFPALVDVSKRLAEQKIIETIRKGTGRMPSFPNLDDARLAVLLDYLGSTRPPEAKTEMGSASNPESETTSNAEGAAVYRDRCAICHGDHREGIAPSFPMLIGLGARLTAAQTTELIHEGKGRMPPMPDLKGAALEKLLDYLGVRTAAEEAEAEDRFDFTGYRKFLDPDGYPAFKPPWGTLSAIDLKTGRYLWKIPLGEYPRLAASGMRNTGSENYGGPIVTASGVLFIGATVFDRKFHAFDTSSGKLLWEFELPFAGMATPSTYMVDGRQYVVTVSSGGRDPNSPVGGAYLAFALSD